MEVAMKVFIPGATGYIGFNVATALRQAGHEGWGLARAEAKARMIVAQEIHPAPSDMQRPERGI
jgi:nucleoside-diphosphate-sugar epimerase